MSEAVTQEAAARQWLERMPVPVFVIDGAGGVLFSNRRFQALGLRPEGFVELASLSEDQDDARTVAVVGADGARSTLSVQARRVQWEAAPAVLCTVPPGAEEDRSLLTVFNAAPLGIAVFNQRLETVRANARLHPIFGDQELVAALDQCRRATRAPSGQVGMGCALHEALSAAVERGSRISDVEVEILDVARAMPLWLRFTVEPLDLHGEPHALLLVSDVTDQHRAERELANAQSLLAAAVEQSPAPIVIADAQVNLRMTNTAGRRVRQAPEGTPLTDLPLADQPERWQTYRPDGTLIPPEELPLSRAILRGEVVQNEPLIIRRPDGEDRWVSASASPVRDAAGEIVAGVVVFPDVTELRLAQERLRLIVDQSLVAVSMVDEAGVLVEWNQGAERLSGLPAPAVLGKPYWDVLTLLAAPDQRTEARRAAFEHAVREALRTGQPSFSGLRQATLTRPDGTVVHFEQYAFPIRSSRGWCLGSIAHDVTEQVRAVAERTEAAEWTRLVFENLDDLVTIVDASGVQVFVGPQVERILGYRPGDLVGTSGFDLVHPDDQAGLASELMEGVATPGLRRRVEYRYRHRDGHWVSFEAIGCNLLDTPVKGIVLSVRDVTDRKQAEAALRQSEERYRAAALATGQLVYDYDLASGRIQWAGAIEAITGQTPEAFAAVGIQEWEQLLHPDERAAVVGALERSLAARAPFQAEYRLRRRDGSYVVVEENGGWLLDAAGAPHRMLGAMKDISERRQAQTERGRLEGQLQQAMKMEAVGRLAGGVAHDFNNILTGITGNVELALMEMSPADPLAERLQEMEKAARSAAALTRQLLAFSRKQIIEPRVITLNELIRNLQKMLVRILGEDVELTADLADDLGSTRVDPGQMEQILVNLAVNARDAMPRGGRLSVHTSNLELDAAWCAGHLAGVSPGQYVLLAVSDTGEGMSAQVKEHLFEPFFTTKPKGQGTGLGLATTYGAVRQAGGAIEVHSELGQGTSFKIYLPRVAEKAQRLEVGPRLDDMPRGTETVLVVEDEAWVRDLAVRVLRMLGYSVLSASHGEEALGLARQRQEPIDLLLTDVVMPGLNGKQVADQLRPLHPEARVLFCSGYTEDVIVHHGVVEEGVHFLAKPYTPGALARKIREVLG